MRRFNADAAVITDGGSVRPRGRGVLPNLCAWECICQWTRVWLKDFDILQFSVWHTPIPCWRLKPPNTSTQLCTGDAGLRWSEKDTSSKETSPPAPFQARSSGDGECHVVGWVWSACRCSASIVFGFVVKLQDYHSYEVLGNKASVAITVKVTAIIVARNGGVVHNQTEHKCFGFNAHDLHGTPKHENIAYALSNSSLSERLGMHLLSWRDWPRRWVNNDVGTVRFQCETFFCARLTCLRIKWMREGKRGCEQKKQLLDQLEVFFPADLRCWRNSRRGEWMCPAAARRSATAIACKCEQCNIWTILSEVEKYIASVMLCMHLIPSGVNIPGQIHIVACGMTASPRHPRCPSEWPTKCLTPMLHYKDTQNTWSDKIDSLLIKPVHKIGI